MASCPCTMCKWGCALGICAWRCLQHGMRLTTISVPVLLVAGVAAARIEVWLREGAHVGMSGAGASGLVWHGVLQGVCRAATMCSARWDSRSLRNVLLLLQTLACRQPSRAGAVRWRWRGREKHAAEWSCSQLSWGRCSWVLPSDLQPWNKTRCLEMLQCEGFGVTKERRECVCMLSAFMAPSTRLNSKFYLLRMGSVLNFVGTAGPLVLPLEGWHVRVIPLGAVGRWIWARSCVEHRVGEAHMPGCKHVCERDPGCLNNVKY